MLFSRMQRPLASVPLSVPVPRLASIQARKALSTTFPRGNTVSPNQSNPNPEHGHGHGNGHGQGQGQGQGEGPSSFKDTVSFVLSSSLS